MTGTIQDEAVLIIENLRHDALQLGFTNDAGKTLVKGDEVILKADGTVDIRDAATEHPLGVVVVGGEDGKRVTVRTFFTCEMNVANANAGTIDAGTLVAPKGTRNAAGYPEYDVVAATNYAICVALVQTATTAIMKVGVYDCIQTAQ